MTPAYFTTRFRILMAGSSPDGSPWTHRKVARAAQEAGHKLSYSYVQSLETGTQANPSLAALRALADVFDVPISFFYEEDQEHELDAALEALQRAGAAKVLTRGAGRLSPDALQALALALQQDDAEDN